MRLAAAVFALLALVACSKDKAEPSALRPYTFQDARFRGLFPSQPQRSEQDVPTAVGNLHLIQYTSEVEGGHGFSVGWFQLAEPLAAEAVQPFLDTTQRGSVTAVEGELESTQYIDAYGGKGIEYAAKMKAGGFVRARNVVLGRDVYVLQVISGKADAPQYREFVDGFEVLPAA